MIQIPNSEDLYNFNARWLITKRPNRDISQVIKYRKPSPVSKKKQTNMYKANLYIILNFSSYSSKIWVIFSKFVEFHHQTKVDNELNTSITPSTNIEYAFEISKWVYEPIEFLLFALFEFFFCLIIYKYWLQLESQRMHQIVDHKSKNRMNKKG